MMLIHSVQEIESKRELVPKFIIGFFKKNKHIFSLH